MTSDSNLLRECIRGLVSEKIRSDTFSMNVFRGLETLDDMHEYAANGLEILGEGAARVAYLLSSRFVLKIAKNDHGVTQNEEEAKAARDTKLNTVLSKVQSSDAKNRWIVTELVRPVKDAKEAANLIGADQKDTFVNVLRQAFRGQLETSTSKSVEAFKSAVHALVKAGHDEGDMFALDHWGKTSDGRLVLLDSGFTEETKNRHFR